MTSHESEDQRYFPRWEVENRVIYRLDGEQTTRMALTRDLSCAGACIITEESFAPLQNIQITIFLSYGTTVKLDGKIIWVSPSVQRSLAGISFNNATSHAQEQILEHAFQFNKDNVVKAWFRGWEF